jgi:hypothetical protein
VSTSAHVRGVDGLKWRRTAVGGCASSLHCAWYSPTDIASVVSSLSDVGLESLSPMLLSHASGADASGAISEGWLALRAGAGTAPASSLLKQRFAFAPCLLVVCPPLAISRGVDTGDQTSYTTSWAPPFNQRTLSCLGYRRDRDMAFTNNRTINNTIILRDSPFWARGAAVPAPAKTAHVKNRESLLASAIS